MNLPFRLVILAGIIQVANALAAQPASVETMLASCREHAASVLHVPASDVTVKYEGQRADKTHAVNGSLAVPGQNRTFQCSFVPYGTGISCWVVDPPQQTPQPARTASQGTVSTEKERQAMERAVAGKFNATGKVPCAKDRGQPMGQCDFGVARAGGGSATVVITRHDGTRRMIHFSKGKATRADTSQADGKAAFRVAKEADLYMITIGTERYEIPEAVVFGG